MEIEKLNSVDVEKVLNTLVQNERKLREIISDSHSLSWIFYYR